mgnify:CR=1 FL=1
MTTTATAVFPIERRAATGAVALDDHLAVEEPLEIRVAHARGRTSGATGAGSAGGVPGLAGVTVAITMRTPGRDPELALGFLHGEGLLHARDEVLDAANCAGAPNVVRVTLAPDVPLERFGAGRRFHATSSCGLCGKDSLAAVLENLRGRRVEGRTPVPAATLRALPERIRARQAAFQRTGGLHAAALVTVDGQCLDLAEDVGRHNAVDKLVGRAWSSGALPGVDRVLFLSGRAGFELVQKAVMAGITTVAAVGAPSSLAVELARTAGVTLVGFLGPERFNVYAGTERIDG